MTTDSEVYIARLKRKLAQRDERIKGLERRVKELTYAVTSAHFEAKRVPVEVSRAVQEALCNVRMIPILGIGGNTRILEVRTEKAEKKPNANS